MRSAGSSARRRPRPWAPSIAQVRRSKPWLHSRVWFLPDDHGDGGVLVLRYGFS
jgi:hypothetical protein